MVIAYPRPWDLIVFLNLLLPIISIIVVIKFKGVIKINGDKNSPYPHLAYSILFPIPTTALRILYDIAFLEHFKIWVISILLSIVFFSWVFFKTNEFSFSTKFEQFVSGFMFLLFCLYCYCSVAFFNFIFDFSEPKIIEVKVIEKKESDSSYSLILEKYWHPLATNNEDGKVSGYFFSNVNSGDIVEVEFREGAFNIPWFQILQDTVIHPISN